MRSKAYMVRTDGFSIERYVLRRIEWMVPTMLVGLTMVGVVSAASLSGVAVLTVVVGQNG